MFCGKTMKLLEEILRYTDISKEHKALIINHGLDNRNMDKIISSHSSTYKGLSDKIDVISVYELTNVNVDNYVVIGVDECSFFKDLYPMIKKWLGLDKHIVCVGLDGNYKMEKFGNVSELVHIANKFTKLNAICSVCLKELTENNQVITPFNTTPAPFTKKIVESMKDDLGNSDDVDIGGADKYIAVCRKHHH